MCLGWNFLCHQTFVNSSALRTRVSDGFALALGTKTPFGLVQDKVLKVIIPAVFHLHQYNARQGKGNA